LDDTPNRQEVTDDDDERRPLLADGVNDRPKTSSEEAPKTFSVLRSILPSLSKESMSVVIKLCLIFPLDSFGSGLTQVSWQSYFYNQKFGLSEGKLGTVFLIAYVLSAFSNLAAAPIARRIGLIKTMVLTHVPASIALALIPVPNNIIIVVLLLAFRATFNSMDQAPRQAFIAAAVLPGERTAVMGAVNTLKTLSQSVGPTVTGALAGKHLFWVAFVLAGSLKLLYDVLILGMFLGYRTVEDRTEERVNDERAIQDEERENIAGLP
jgi:MFS family permease